MVWFQCEDCGENLKKPKLPNHFRICSSTKLSCIDCGETFGQLSVQGHTQCITEAEKYGPKGQKKASNGTTPKPNNDSKQQPDIDTNVGLSERPPWFCSLCKTKATSKQALLLHAEGKKHRAKSRAVHASKQQLEQAEGSAQDTEALLEGTPKVEEPKVDGKLSSKKKRKHDASEKDGTQKKSEGNTSDEVGYGEVIQVGKAEVEETMCELKKPKHNVPKEDEVLESNSTKEKKKKIKWFKLITSALKSNPDGVLKMRKLRKLVTKALQDSGITGDECQLNEELEQRINSSARFKVDDKYVRLVSWPEIETE
ncbi:zf-LYAR domain-containing protein/zf-met domain-containing protein [Cephalotus follicularis]|uniref:Zf-LYAR domain-containing protein/zf-met domain-containing protein n=1 Tax=Cephalotus follicularis TaxID=3775 RepID=A0A1Q3BY86_CEPFO|nr:zf-LYAR domain-containing protein/zf-met domain-containing protein [Cephalotus follicularis]